MKLSEEIDNYEPNQTMNVTDLKRVPVDEEMFTSDKKTNAEGEDYVYKYLLRDGIIYRVPGVVIGDMKEIRKSFPDTKAFIVTKKGTGKATRYTVMPSK